MTLNSLYRADVPFSNYSLTRRCLAFPSKLPLRPALFPL